MCSLAPFFSLLLFAFVHYCEPVLCSLLFLCSFPVESLASLTVLCPSVSPFLLLSLSFLCLCVTFPVVSRPSLLCFVCPCLSFFDFYLLCVLSFFSFFSFFFAHCGFRPPTVLILTAGLARQVDGVDAMSQVMDEMNNEEALADGIPTMLDLMRRSTQR